MTSLIVSAPLFFIFLEIGSRYYYERYYLKEAGISDKPIILTIGDSFCVPKISFPFVLGKKLQGQYKVINAAEVGIGPDHYLMNMSLNLKKGPYVCIVSFYLGNDIIDIRDFQLRPTMNKIKLFFGKRLYSYQVARTIWARIKHRVPEKDLKKALKKGIRNPQLYTAGKHQPRIVIRNLAIEGEDIVGAWDTLRSLVAQMKKLAQSYKVPLYALLIPDCIQVSDNYQSLYKKAGFEIDRRTSQMAKPQQLMGRILHENQIQFLDLLPEFKKVNGQGIYFHDDPHMTQKGHAIVAKSLIEKLYHSNLLR